MIESTKCKSRKSMYGKHSIVRYMNGKRRCMLCGAKILKKDLVK